MSCGGGLTSGKINALGGMLVGTGVGTEKIDGLIAEVAASPVVNNARNAVKAVVGQANLEIPLDVANAAGGLDELGQNLADNAEAYLDAHSISDNIVSAAKAMGSAAPSLFGKSPAGFGSLGYDLLDAVSAEAHKFFPNGDISSFTQVFNQALSFSQTSLENMTSITALFNTDFGSSIIDAVKDYNVGGFLGDNITTFDNLITNGLSSLTSGDLGELGTAIFRTGDFGNLNDLANLGSAGQIVEQIIQAGAGEIGGILEKVTNLNIPFDELLNPEHQESLLNILDSVTNITDITDMQTIFNSALNLDTLGDLTRLHKLIPAELQQAVFDDYGGLINVLRSADLGNMTSMGDLGALLTTLNQTEFLSLVQAQTTLLDPKASSVVQAFFSGGTGAFNSILLQDIMGTTAGYTHDVSMPRTVAALAEIELTGLTADLKAMLSELATGAQGGYTVESTLAEEGGGNSAKSYEITDPRTSIIYTVLDDFLTAKIGQINAETAIVISDPDVAAQLIISENEWQQIAEQVARERALFSKTNIDLDAITPKDTGSLFSFADRLHEFGLDLDNANDYITRMSTSDLYGEFVQYALLEGQNFEELADVGTLKIIAEEIVGIEPTTPTQGIFITAGSTDEFNWTGFAGSSLTTVAESSGPAIFNFTGLAGSVTSEVDITAGATTTFNYTGYAATVTTA